MATFMEAERNGYFNNWASQSTTENRADLIKVKGHVFAGRAACKVITFRV